MLSRLAKRAVLGYHSSPCVSNLRFYSSPVKDEPYYEHREPWQLNIYEKVEIAETADPSKIVASEVTDYVPQPTPFNSPLRDHVNFPKPIQPEYPAPSRLAVFPESWFKFLYPKIGVTGPYTLGIGILLFLVSKEILIIDDAEFKHIMAFFTWIYVLVKTPLGFKIRDFIWDPAGGPGEFLEKLRKSNEKLRLDAIAHEKEQQWRLEGKKLLYDAKKENVCFQLEASYRQTFMDVYNQVKRRLDYQIEVAKIDERIKQQFMVQWVLDRVKESIGQTSEKENLKQCIANLNILAARV